MNRIYCAIGKIVELTQTIELELGDILENSEIIKEFGRLQRMTKNDYDQVLDDAGYIKEKMRTMTFGSMIAVLRDSRSLSYDEITELKTLLEKRNYFAHEYFKYTNFENATEDLIVDEFEAIKADLVKLKQMLNRLNLIKENQITRINYLLSKNGL